MHHCLEIRLKALNGLFKLIFFFFFNADLPSASSSETDTSFICVCKRCLCSLQTYLSESGFWDCPLFTKCIF